MYNTVHFFNLEELSQICFNYVIAGFASNSFSLRVKMANTVNLIMGDYFNNITLPY